MRCLELWRGTFTSGPTVFMKPDNHMPRNKHPVLPSLTVNRRAISTTQGGRLTVQKHSNCHRQVGQEVVSSPSLQDLKFWLISTL